MSRSKLAGMLAIAGSMLLAPAAQAAVNLFLGGGATAQSTEGFQGGWGFTTAAEVPFKPAAYFLVRADYHIVPDARPRAIPIIEPFSASWLGSWPSGASRLEMGSLLAGFRLHSPSERFRTYLDALVGVGHVPSTQVASTRTRMDTNVALSFGAGARLGVVGRVMVFGDAHYDFYFVEGRTSPIVPIRLGFGIPVGGERVSD